MVRPRLWIILLGLAIAGGSAFFLARPPARDPLDLRIAESFEVGGSPLAIAVTQDAVWISDGDERALIELDPTTGEIRARTRLPFLPAELVVAEGYVWVGAFDGTTMARVSEGGGRPKLIDVGRTPQSLSVADDVIWVAAFDDGLIRTLDPDSGELTRDRFKLKDSFPSDLIWAFDRLWVTDVVEDVVTDENHADATVVGDSPVAITAGEGAVWTANFNDRTVSRIDPVTRRTGRPIIVGGKPSAIAAGAGFIWVARVEDDALIAIDGGDGVWTGDVLKVGDQPQAIAVDGESVWVANQGDGTVVRVEVSE